MTKGRRSHNDALSVSEEPESKGKPVALGNERLSYTMHSGGGVRDPARRIRLACSRRGHAMATARQFLFIARCRNMKAQQIFARANQIQKAISEQGFEARRMDKGEIKRLLALYFDASMYGEQMPDSDGEQFFDECMERTQ